MILKNFLVGKNGVKISVDFDVTPHLLIVGPTGSRKTTATRLLIGKLALQNSDVIFRFADFKNWGDYDFAKNKLLDMQDAIDDGDMMLKTRQGWHHDIYEPYFLILDEFPSFILSLDSKERKKYQSSVSRLLMMGRSFNIHLVLIAQRPDSSLFSNGARDNFGFRLGLGGLSSESRTMLFSGEKGDPDWFNNKPGEGILYREGIGVSHVKLPVFDLKKLEKFLENYFK